MLHGKLLIVSEIWKANEGTKYSLSLFLTHTHSCRWHNSSISSCQKEINTNIFHTASLSLSLSLSCFLSCFWYHKWRDENLETLPIHVSFVQLLMQDRWRSSQNFFWETTLQFKSLKVSSVIEFCNNKSHIVTFFLPSQCIQSDVSNLIFLEQHFEDPMYFGRWEIFLPRAIPKTSNFACLLLCRYGYGYPSN